MSTSEALPRELQDQFRQLRARLRGQALIVGLGRTALAVVLIIFSLLLLDLCVELPGTFRMVLLAALAGATLAALGMMLVRPALRHYRLEELAAAVELAWPELQGRLLSAVQLAGENREYPGKMQALQKRNLQHLVDFAASHPFAGIVSVGLPRRTACQGVLACVALLLPVCLAPECSRLLFARLIHPRGNYERVGNLQLLVDRTDPVAGRGDDVVLRVRPAWRLFAGVLPRQVWADVLIAGEPVQSRRMDWNSAENVFEATLPQVQASFRYSVRAGRARTAHHQISVMDRPEIVTCLLEVTPPEQSGLPPVQFTPFLNEAVVPEQAWLRLQVQTRSPIQTASLVWDQPASAAQEAGSAVGNREKNSARETGLPGQTVRPMTLDSTKRLATLEWQVTPEMPTGRFVIQVKNAAGLTARQALMRRVTVQQDQAPRVEFTATDTLSVIRPQDLLRIPVQATDDGGLSAVELHLQWRQNGQEKTQVLSALPESGLTRHLRTEFAVDLQALGLASGDRLTFQACARDRRLSPGPQVGWTESRSVTLHPSALPAGAESLARHHRQLHQEIDRLQADLERLRRRAAARQEPSPSQQETPQNSSDQSAASELALGIRSLSDRMRRLEAEFRPRHVTRSLADQVGHLADHTLRLAGEPLRQKKDIAAPDPADFREVAARLQQAGEELQTVQTDFQQLAVNQRDFLELNGLGEQVERLITQLETLQTRPALPASQGDAATQQDRQEQLHPWQARRDETVQALDQLLQNHPELLEAARDNIRQRLFRLGEQADQLARRQQGLIQAERQGVHPSQEPAPSSESASYSAESGSSEQSSVQSTLLERQQQVQRQARSLGKQVRLLKLKNEQALQGGWKFSDAARQAADALLEWRIADAGNCARNAATQSRAWSRCLAQAVPGISEAELQAVREVSAAQGAIAAELETLALSPAAQSTLAGQLQVQQLDAALRLEQALTEQTAALRLLEPTSLKSASPMPNHAEAGTSEADSLKSDTPEADSNRPASQLPATQVEEAARQVRQALEHLHAAQSHSRQGSHDSAIQFGEQAVTQFHRVRRLIRQAAQVPNVAESSEPAAAGDIAGQLVRALDQLRNVTPMADSEETFPVESLRRVADQLRQAAWQMGVSASTPGETPLARQQSGHESAYSTSSDALASPFLGEVHLSPRESSFSTGSREAWGELPAAFQTQLLQATPRQSPPDYRQWIERYFETITRHSPLSAPEDRYRK